LQIPCTLKDGTLNNCSADELAEIQKFSAYTKASLKTALELDPANRTVWAPACVFHCSNNYGDMSDPGSNKMLSPTGSQNTVGIAAREFIIETVRGKDFIDTVQWPDNAQCSGNGTKSFARSLMQ
jgi:hypothetical protein